MKYYDIYECWSIAWENVWVEENVYIYIEYEEYITQIIFYGLKSKCASNFPNNHFLAKLFTKPVKAAGALAR